MYVSHLSLHSFRSYESLELALDVGATSLLGRNGQGKTNIVEAIDYLSRLTSHRVASDLPLVKQGAERAVVRASVVKQGRTAVLEVEINPGRANRARVNRTALPRPRELIGLVRTVLFAPGDLQLVKGDPAERRRFLDDVLVLLSPRLVGVRADYDRVLRQRNTLLRKAMTDRRSSRQDEYFESTLAVWDAQLVSLGVELVRARAALVEDLAPRVAQAYAAVAKNTGHDEAMIRYLPSVRSEPGEHTLEESYQRQLEARRREEVQRGITLVGPHRDELELTVGPMPVKGYASHGESWSMALALRLGCFDLVRQDGDDPVLILDDVFAELDADRRERLADLVADAEQVLVTAAVPADVPDALRGARIDVRGGTAPGEPNGQAPQEPSDPESEEATP